jgi:hypothetical protein
MTIAPGAPIDAADILAAIARTGCKLRNPSQSIVTATQTDISWTIEDEDTNAFHVGGTASAVVIPTGFAGLYSITYGGLLTGLTVGTRVFGSINIITAVTGGHLDQYRDRTDFNEDRYQVGITVPLLDGDSFTCNVFHSQGANLPVSAFLSCYRVGL